MRMLRLSTLSRILLSLLALHPGRLHPQASSTASKNTELSVFAAYSLVDPDNRNSGKNNGFTFGGDYTHLFPRNFALSLEPRVKFAPGDVVGERTYGGGGRFEYRIKNLVPYVDYIWSYGILTLTNPTSPYKRDNSIVHSPGFGLDAYLTPQWAVRVDYQFERWKVTDSNSFHPRALSFGVVYRIPFRPYVHR
jgi:hypothetical protein